MPRQLQAEFLLDQLVTRAHSKRTQALYQETFGRFTLTLADFVSGEYLHAARHQLGPVTSYHTARGHLSRLQTFARWLVDNQHIEQVAPLRLRYLKPRDLEIPSAEELASLLAAMRDRVNASPPGRARTTQNNYLITRVILSTGARVSEALSLQSRDLQQNEELAWLHIRGTKTSSSSRSVVICSELLTLLRAHAPAGTHSLLFQSRRRLPLSARDFANYLREFARTAGLVTHITPHVLRYTFIMHQVAAGKSLFEVMTMAGHASPRQTIYYFNRVRRLMPMARVSPDIGFIEKGS